MEWQIDYDGEATHTGDRQWQFLGITQLMILSAIFFVIFVVVFSIYHFLVESKSSRQTNAVDDRHFSDEPAGFGLQKSVREFYGYVFTSVGELCVENPFLVIILAVIATGVASLQLRGLRTTFDPILLWPSTDSDAYQQRSYFLANFKPLPRNSQVIVSFNPDCEDTKNQTKSILERDIILQVSEYNIFPLSLPANQMLYKRSLLPRSVWFNNKWVFDTEGQHF